MTKLLSHTMKNREKIRAQVKSRFYYLFWGIATFSVVAGQTYVGTGYRAFANALNRVFDTIEVEVQRDPMTIDAWDDNIGAIWTK
tara:strand:- start:95 stop:349 length:255 start_codon:yes stop_codon:yes gene_type:complete